MRRTPDAFKRDGKTEKWTYECAACSYKIEHTVDLSDRSLRREMPH